MVYIYKLAIVEDERDVKSRLVNMIEKSGGNFEIAGEYENGIDAYEGILSDNPDLILTDIRIPYINGIELSKKVREVFPLIKIIIITGYNEFDYAKEAANLGVIGFVSKPVTLENIRRLLRKAEDSLDGEYLSASNLSELSTFYINNLPIINENDLYRLSKMTEVAPAFENRLRGNGVSLDYRYFVMCMFDFDEIPEGGSERYDYVFSSIRKSVSEDLKAPAEDPGGRRQPAEDPGERWQPADTPENPDPRRTLNTRASHELTDTQGRSALDFDLFTRYEKLCLLIKSNALPDIKELERLLERIILRTGRFSKMPVSAGISNVYTDNKNFASMTKEAERALEYRGVMGGQKVFFYGNAEAHTTVAPAFGRQLPATQGPDTQIPAVRTSEPPTTGQPITMNYDAGTHTRVGSVTGGPSSGISTAWLATDENAIRELGYILHTRTAAECVSRIENIRKSMGRAVNSVYYTATNILNVLIKACDDPEGMYGKFGGWPDDMHRKLFGMKTADEIFEYLKETARAVRSLNDGVITDNVERSVRKVISYMEAHFCDPDINFESLAREVNYSVSYISALLKREKGASFVKILTDLRIEKAKELLANPALKIIDIAERLGYNDSYYFSHCFKKHVGISPKEFRNSAKIY